jgi:hypothetical protein
MVQIDHATKYTALSLMVLIAMQSKSRKYNNEKTFTTGQVLGGEMSVLFRGDQMIPYVGNIGIKLLCVALYRQQKPATNVSPSITKEISLEQKSAILMLAAN